jgi:hypothetical protein
MTIEEQRKAIIEDASRKEFEAWYAPRDISVETAKVNYPSVGEDVIKAVIAIVKDESWHSWQAARNQSNNVPVAIEVDAEKLAEHLGIELEDSYEAGSKYSIGDTELLRIYNAGKTSPQQSNALEMAAKVCDEQAKELREFAEPLGAGIAESCANLIRALIPQPESDGK